MDYHVKKITTKYKNSVTESNARNSLTAKPASHNMYGLPSTNAHHFLTPQYQPSPTNRLKSMLNCFEPPYSRVSKVD